MDFENAKRIEGGQEEGQQPVDIGQVDAARKASTEKPADAWRGYLDKTGNPMLEEMKREAGINLREGIGGAADLQNIPEQGRRELRESQERQTKLVADFLFDASVSDTLLEGITYTGDLKKDAENLFQSTGMKRALTRLQSGEDPKSLLTETAQTADKLAEDAKGNDSLRQAAYTVIKIGKAIEKILEGAN